MNIKETFLNLTKKTYPYGTEDGVISLLPNIFEVDEFGNLYKQIGETPSTMFTSHLDTACSKQSDVNHVFDGEYVKTDGLTILGADDKAGVTLMLYMIHHNIPGLYYFFLGEEVGCVGSKKVANKHKKEPIEYIKKVISFDRRGTDSVITHQSYQRCASDNFSNKLANALNVADNDFNYKLDDTGVCTDSLKFIEIYPECTNISVGYYNEHTYSEKQDLYHLQKLGEALIKIDFESLPYERDFTKKEYKQYKYSGYSGGIWESDCEAYEVYNKYYKKNWKKVSKPKTVKKWFLDDKFTSYVELDEKLEIKSVQFSKSRLDFESEIIGQFLMSIDIDYKKYKWNGSSLNVEYNNGNYSECKREELEDFIPELDFWKEIVTI